MMQTLFRNLEVAALAFVFMVVCALIGVDGNNMVIGLIVCIGTFLNNKIEANK